MIKKSTVPAARRTGAHWQAGLMGIAIAAAAGPASAQPAVTCLPPAEARVVAELYFGRNIGEVLGVSEQAWAAFVEDEITPRFPDGISVLDLAGQWRDSASGRIVREPGKLLIIVLGRENSSLERLAEIVEAYKKKFQQQSVMMLQRPACVAF